MSNSLFVLSYLYLQSRISVVCFFFSGYFPDRFTFFYLLDWSTQIEFLCHLPLDFQKNV